MTIIKLQDPACNVVQEVSVVRDGNDSALIIVEMSFQPRDTLCVKVVCRLIQKKDIWLLQKETDKSNTSTFTTRDNVYRCIRMRTAQGVHCHFQLRINVPRTQSINLLLQLCLLFEKLIEIGIGITELLADRVIILQQLNSLVSPFLNDLANRLARIELRLLRKIPEGHILILGDLTNIFIVQSGNDFQERRLTGAVQTENSDLSAVEKAQIDVA